MNAVWSLYSDKSALSLWVSVLMRYQKIKLRPAELCRWPEPLKLGWQGWNGMPINAPVLLRFSVTDGVLILCMRLDCTGKEAIRQVPCAYNLIEPNCTSARGVSMAPGWVVKAKQENTDPRRALPVSLWESVWCSYSSTWATDYRLDVWVHCCLMPPK